MDFHLCIQDLRVKHGEFFGLIGESGCGKTTLLKILAGLLPVDEGSLFQNGSDITGIPAEKRALGMVFQQDRLFPYMNVEKNVAFGLKMKGVPRSKRITQARDMLSSVGLKDLGDRFPSELSGGQRQRVAIARAMVTNPPVLLMDEPFSSLDPNLRKEMRELVLNIHRKYSMTIIFVTHDREEAFMMFDRMSIMKNGNVVETGTPRSLYEKPSRLYTARFLGIPNILSGRTEKGLFLTLEGLELSLEKNEGEREGELIIRPESLEITQFNPEGRFAFRAVLEQTLFRQGMVHCKITTPRGLNMETLQKNNCDLEDLTGKEVYVSYSPPDLVFLEREKEVTECSILMPEK